VEGLEKAWKKAGKDFPYSFQDNFVDLKFCKTDMHKELLIQAYGKVKEELLKETGVLPSDRKCIIELSAIISETFPYGERSLRKLYKNALKDTEEDIVIKQPQVLLALAKYIGYTDYRDFVIKNNGKINTPEKIKTKRQKRNIRFKVKYQFLITITFIAVIGFFGYLYFNRQRWMEWKDDHYSEVSFNAEKIKGGKLKLYKEERIESFRQIAPTCNTLFFNKDGSVRVWYGKSKEKELEYFTDLGLHPETGKTLKPISQYMIDKYICQ